EPAEPAEPVAPEPADEVDEPAEPVVEEPAPVAARDTRVPINPGTPPVEDEGEDREPLNDREVLGPLDSEGIPLNINDLAPQVNPAPTPPLPDRCGVDVAIVLDMSGSLSSLDVSNSRLAARAVVTALEGTPSAVGVYSFSTD